MQEYSGFPLDEALQYLQGRIHDSPDVFLVLGSGLSELAQGVESAVIIPFEDVPGFPSAGVEGHTGRLISGPMSGRGVLIQSGRFHFYEGHPGDVVVAPVRLAGALGAKMVILTNAAGGIAEDLEAGSILLLDDFLNLMFRNPLVGPVREGEDRFPDMSQPFDAPLRERALALAPELGIPLRRGVYAAVLGPSYETPAEVRFLEKIGAHAVGMSTVPEVIAARAQGLRVLAFSLITNRAAGMGAGTLDHQEVLEVGKAAGGKLGSLIQALLPEIPGQGA